MKLKNQAMPNDIELTAEAVFDFEAAEKSETKLPQFRMTAYTGNQMDVGFGLPVVVDLDGLDLTGKARPVLFNHDRTASVGHTANITKLNGQLEVMGIISGTSGIANQITADARNGFPWQISIGAKVNQQKLEKVKANEKVNVNGREFTGPLYVARASTLKEISFVSLGADDDTSATLAAKMQEQEMKPELKSWIEAQGFDTDSLSEAQIVFLTASYEKEQEEVKAQAEKEAAEKAELEAKNKETDDLVAAEKARIDSINAIEASENCDVEKIASIKAEAIKESWPVVQAELEILRAQRPAAPKVHIKDSKMDKKILEAAACKAAGLDIEAMERNGKPVYDEQTLEGADNLTRGSFGFKALIAHACKIDGVEVPDISASHEAWLQAAWSTNTFSVLLNNTMNKTLMGAFNSNLGVCKRVSRKLVANDFKTQTGVRVYGTGTAERVNDNGEIKNGNMSETSYTYSVGTIGEMITIGRKDIVNDSLGAFMQVPEKLGRDAATKLEKDFWAHVIANSNGLFSSVHGNLVETTSSVLGVAGLDKAVETFQTLKDANANYIAVQPSILLVPPALSSLARRLMNPMPLIATGVTSTSKTDASGNNHAGMFEVVVAPWLQDSSKTAWYLMADPANIAAFGIAYLNGRETPTIEEAALPGNVLGKGWRMYFDYGICDIDYQGAVKMTGAN